MVGVTYYIYPDMEEARKEGRAATKVSDITLEEYKIINVDGHLMKVHRYVWDSNYLWCC